ncbi:SAP domain-containing protein [Staphylococcus shinii]|uniref:SAP domain-containing protein n=1 Tax=Staphylococcus shinii TaxID=2912228 RepID=UPI003F871AC1
MDLNAYDLLILHLNVNRKVGNEVTHHNYIIENKIPVSKHLQNLIDKDILVLKSDYNNSLPLLKIPELKEILRNNNLKVGGKKQELIERIKTNVPIQKVQLDEVYVATSKGKELIKETEYILHFYNSHLISLASAHNIANKNINSEDKIETIYQSLIKKSLNSSNEQYNLISILHSLIRYYKKIDKDETQIRQFVNFLVYLELSRDLEHLSLLFKFGETVNDISGSFYINSDNLEYYENQLLIKKEKKQTLKTLFYKDIILFINADQNLCEEFFISFYQRCIINPCQKTILFIYVNI